MGMGLNWRLGSTPTPPNRPVNPFQFENLAVGLPFRRPRRHEPCKRLLKREPGIIYPVIQRVHRLAAEGNGFQPRCKG